MILNPASSDTHDKSYSVKLFGKGKSIFCLVLNLDLVQKKVDTTLEKTPSTVMHCTASPFVIAFSSLCTILLLLPLSTTSLTALLHPKSRVT